MTKHEPKRILITETNDYIFETEIELVPINEPGQLGFTLVQRTRITRKSDSPNQKQNTSVKRPSSTTSRKTQESNG